MNSSREGIKGTGRSTSTDVALLRILTCGNVDDGKSTLIGRLLYDLGLVPTDEIRTLETYSRLTSSTGELDFASLLDGLEAEREQGITIDVAYRFFRSARRSFIVADCPGHEQYTRNMATGASVSDLAIILVDARKGILTQTRRHSLVVSLFGIRHVVLVVNKCDLVNYSRNVFQRIVDHYLEFANNLGFRTVTAVPISALYGENLVRPSANMSWYDGPVLIDILEDADIETERRAKPLRMPVQWVCRTGANFRGFSGTIVSGSLRRNDAIMIAESGKTTTVTRISVGEQGREEASAGTSVMLSFADEIDASRGDVLCQASDRPEIADQFAAQLLWLSDEPMLPGRSYLMRIGTRAVAVSISSLKYRVDIQTGSHAAAKKLELNEIGICNLSLASAVAFDSFTDNRDMGSFILIDRFNNTTVAAGMISFGLRRAHNIYPDLTDESKRKRVALKGHRPAALWLTGLSGAGKTTIARSVEHKLNARGCHTYLIDGDNLRARLNRDLGFTNADRVENVRRTSEVARLFVDAGLIAIVALISPFRSERLVAREQMQPGEFVEIHVSTPIEVCRQRDPKGLYRKADRGELFNFTGVDSPYETPESPELRLDTTASDSDALADDVINYLLTTGIIY
jgi:bifunctional enzyme CysN/CysC